MKTDVHIKRRRLGRTNLEVTELGFGAMNLRLMKSYAEAEELVHYVLDNNINLIDTARVYNGEISPGIQLESEVVVGSVIKSRSDLTEPIVIVTKGHGYTVTELHKDLMTSREKLGITGKGDLRIGNNPIKLVYFLHGISTERWEIIRSSGVLNELKAIREEGLINFAGFSSHYPFPDEIKEAVDTEVFDVVELPYNVFNRSLGEDGALDLLKYISQKNIGIINMKAFDGNGMPPVYKMLREFVTIDYEKMLNFCLSNPYISTVDAGAKAIKEFELDIKTALGERLSSDERNTVKEEADKVSGYMKDLCRQCMHCYEKFQCPEGIPFVDTLALYSRYRLAEGLGKDTEQFTKAYTGLEKRGRDCIKCGKCKAWCEYKLDIPEMMKTAEEYLE